jgi:cytochrome c oxidase assembly protein subunit 11
MGAPPTNWKLLRRCVAISAIMFGFGYLLSPLYATFCRVTGLNRLEAPDAAVASAVQRDASRTVLMQFDSNLRDGLPWAFRPMQTTLAVHPGELVRVAYEARNNSDRTIIGQAIASYAPEGAAAYVRKLQCFCFSAQKLGPHEVKNMPVLFMIDPSLPQAVSTVTLSYTFFDLAGAAVSPAKWGT